MGGMYIYSILIVEDVKEQRQFLMESAMGYNSEIKIFSSDKKVEAMDIIRNNDIDAFFLDIQLVDGSGLELANEIRNIKKYQFTPIVFITGVITKEIEAFHRIHCYDYIVKPYTKKSISDIMKNIMVDYFDKYREDVKYLNLEFKGIKQRININDIVCIESKNRRIYIRTINEDIPYKLMNIRQVIKELPDYFIQIHQSIIVNSYYVAKIDLGNNVIALKGISDTIPIGISYRKRVGEILRGIC